VSWLDAFNVLRSPSIGPIMLLGLLLIALFLLWLVVAQVIYVFTLGPGPPPSVAAFLSEVFTTGAGWAMIAIGIGVGFLFAALVLAISVVSFHAARLQCRDWHGGFYIDANRGGQPGHHGVMGPIVAGGPVLGSLPLFVGLAAPPCWATLPAPPHRRAALTFGQAIRPARRSPSTTIRHSTRLWLRSYRHARCIVARSSTPARRPAPGV
jgi:hypothetical protein